MPETPSEVCDWSQHTPVRWSHTSPAVHCATAAGAATRDHEITTALHTEANRAAGADVRILISMRLRR
ncbi:hypothetical protein AU190_18405 [Mycolicibacterium acapulense]|uniref:Uncharacterized protein n=1 Tax=Mycobacterium lehmannii TaxID=2048550 RepID=A0A101AEC1_9MYCO|nr:hypothetical protein AU189_14290 [Mycolicibacterium acapulense]KUI03395.1 hypothetical protein AU190_18405 [Mycolicibacterium acapulense]KUI15007.1 hypothetical protein AU191_15045 [Mycolicibacterium acapulense]KUI21277.1 hypothetical protein AU192_12715 [Mycobacterium lehmannii]